MKLASIQIKKETLSRWILDFPLAVAIGVILAILLSGRQVLAQIPGEAEFSLSLEEGWNLISLPADPIDSDPKDIFQEVPAERIWELQGNQLNPATSVIPGLGYWIFSPEKKSVDIPTQIPTVTETQLDLENWHLIGAVETKSFPGIDADLIIWGWEGGRFITRKAIQLSDLLQGSYVFALKSILLPVAFPNSPPEANAGNDQILPLGSLVMLDGSRSSDPNNHPLTYSWSFLEKPSGSSATLSDFTIVNPSFTLDLLGKYELQLLVNDGLEDSPANSVLITIDSSKQGTLDLNLLATNPGVLTRVYGSVSDGNSGLPVAGGFDCDGDQLIDYAFSSMKASPLGRSRAGEVALVFGTSIGMDSIGETLDSAGFKERILKIAGEQLSENTGAEIWMDDVTGDGLGDLLICRQNFAPEVGREGAGALSIIIGGPELRTHAKSLQYLDLSNPPGDIKITTFYGVAAYDRLGIWVRTGDVNGDTIADIVVGSDEVDGGNEEKNRGAVFVIRGGSHLAVSQTIDLADFSNTLLEGHVARINPPANSGNYHFGATCQIADLDGNGRGEVLAAAALNRAGAGLRLPDAPSGTGQSSGGSPDGSLFIVWDENFPEGVWESDFEIDLENLIMEKYSRIDGATLNRAFGEEILGGLDYDDDDKPDLFVGDLVANAGIGSQSGTGHVFFDAKKLKGLTFNMNTPPSQLTITFIKGPSSGALAGDTATHGDFNNDGIDDLVVGNPHDVPKGRISAGTMHILYGQAGGWPAEIDLRETLLPTPEVIKILRIDGAKGGSAGDAGDTLCYSATAADVDKDGYTDVIVNEMVGNGPTPETIDVGNLLLISGAALTGK